MYSKFDFEKKLLMVGFTPDRLSELMTILKLHIDSKDALIKEAQEILTFLEASRLAMIFSCSGVNELAEITD
jgi:hypothetical protein